MDHPEQEAHGDDASKDGVMYLLQCALLCLSALGQLAK